MKLGTIESVWRYPVKSMRGEEVNDVYVAYTGVMGDRIYAVSSSTAVPEFPWHTNREQEEFVLYQPRFKNREKTLKPADLEATYAEMLNPPYPMADDFAVDVELPSGEVVDIDDPAFLDGLRDAADGDLTLRYTQKIWLIAIHCRCSPCKRLINSVKKPIWSWINAGSGRILM